MRARRKVFATRRLPPAVTAKMKRHFDLRAPSPDRPLTTKEIVRQAAGAEGLVAMLSDAVDAKVLARCPSLKIVANYAVGFNNVDLRAASARKVYVTNTPGVLTETTADLAWALILAAGRRLAEGDRLVRSGKWDGWAPTQLLGRDVYGKTLGVVGMGRIGRAVARRARGFEMRVLYFSRRRLPASEERRLGAAFAPLNALLAKSDYVSLHVPLTPRTRHLIGQAQLARMRPQACLINTARGPVVDERALIAALRSRRLAGAGLDVFEEEPKVSKSLLALPHAVVLPHIGSASVETRDRMGLMVLENLLAVFGGKTPPHWVNPF